MSCAGWENTTPLTFFLFFFLFFFVFNDFLNYHFTAIHLKLGETVRQKHDEQTLLKKRLWHRCFPANFAKFLKTPFLQNNFGCLLLCIHVKRKRKRWFLIKQTRNNAGTTLLTANHEKSKKLLKGAEKLLSV